MLSASVEPQFPSSTSAAFHHLKRRRSASPPGDDDNGFPDPKRPDIPRWASVIQPPSSEPPVMEVVRKAEQILINSGSMDVESDIADFNNLYLPPIFRMKHLPLRPLLDFSKLSAKLIFGAESPAVLENRVATVPCLSASSLSVGAEFLARHYPKRTIYIPLQTWGIHKKIFRLAGLCVKTYRYYDQKMHGLHLKAMLEDLGSATGGEVVLLHACGQGVDPTLDQWKKIRKLMKEKGLLPFFDSTYQGLASGNLDSDAMAVRMFVARGGECFVAQSYGENMGLYGECVDAFSIVCSSAKVALKFESQLKLVIEPMHNSLRGASIVTTILGDSEMWKEWFIELKATTDRTSSIRQQLFDSLCARGTLGDWSHITKQIGMFTFTGLSMQQAALVTKGFHIYITTDGQISMKGLTSETVPLLVDAIHGVVAGQEQVDRVANAQIQVRCGTSGGTPIPVHSEPVSTVDIAGKGVSEGEVRLAPEAATLEAPSKWGVVYSRKKYFSPIRKDAEACP